MGVIQISVDVLCPYCNCIFCFVIFEFLSSLGIMDSKIVLDALVPFCTIISSKGVETDLCFHSSNPSQCQGEPIELLLRLTHSTGILHSDALIIQHPYELHTVSVEPTVRGLYF